MTDNAIWAWSTTAATNASADSTVNQAEGMGAAIVNNSARAEMARHKAFIDITGGNTNTVTFGGTGNAYTITSPSGHAITSLVAGMMCILVPNATNSGAVTVAWDGLTDDVKKANGDALVSGDLVSGGSYLLRYTGSVFHVVGMTGAGAFQPLDAQLTDVAGLTPTDNAVIIGNGTNFVVESGATLKTSLGLTIGTDVQAFSANLTTWSALAPSANHQTLVTQTFAQMRASLDLEAGTDFYSIAAANAAFQAIDADLTSIAALTTTAAGRSILELADPNVDAIGFWDDSAGRFVFFTSIPPGLTISGTTLLLEETMCIAVSDETTAITTGTGKAFFAFPYDVTITDVSAVLNTVSSSGIPTFDINEGGTTILSTKLTIDANEKASSTAATAAVISDTAIAAFAEMSVDIDVAGTGAKGAKIFIKYRRTT